MSRVSTPAPQRAAARKRLAKAGKALSDGSYPIPNTEYLKKAIRGVGRASAGKRPALAALIRKRAAQLGPSGLAALNGSWADNKQSTRAMAQALRGQLIELGFSPEQASIEVLITVPFIVQELAAKSWDPDSDGDNDASPSGDKDNDFAGKLNPKQKATLKKLVAKGMNAKLAYKMASNVKSKAA